MALVSEYNQRSRLKKLGFADSLDDLDSVKADAFLAISEEIDAAEAKRHKAAEAKAKGGSVNGR